MRISTKGRYTLRLMLDLALHRNDGYISLKDISERQDISKKYLEQIVPALTKSGMLKANRGYQGGYMLTKSPENYTAGDIIRLAEGSLAPVPCLDFEVNSCPRADICMTFDMWKGLYEVINNYLDGITLQDLIDRNNGAGDYVI